jgi:hypothetical protein
MGSVSLSGSLEVNKMQENMKERYFSIELKAKVNLKNVTLTNNKLENVLIEGSIGRLVRAEFAEGIILEVVGDKGVLRINLGQDEIKQKETQSKEVQNA